MRTDGAVGTAGHITLERLLPLLARYRAFSLNQKKRVTDGPTDGRTDGPTDGRTDRRTDGRPDGWTDPHIEMCGSI